MRLFLYLLLLLPASSVFSEEDAAASSLRIDYQEAVYDFGGPLRKIFLKGPVVIESASLRMTCDEAEVHSRRVDAGDGSASVASLGVIDYILATGQVVIRQGASTAHAGRAEVFPAERRLVLEDHPRIEDPNGVVEGFRIIYLQGERKIKVESDPDAGPSRIRLNQVSEVGNLMDPNPVKQGDDEGE
jgi:lipopolysaccharide export system protein LptA